MLSQSLKKLERDGILTRTVMKAEPPAVVTYALTPLGRELQKSTSALVDFWNKNQAEICERRFINAEVARAAELRADEPGAGASA
jgi:DNA-binding HxlR family transcriptional regulator